MNTTDRVPHAQDAEKGHKYLVAAIDPRTGRQVVNLYPEAILPPLVEIRSTGWRWHDREGHEWERDVINGWEHSSNCVCQGARSLDYDGPEPTVNNKIV